MTTYHGYPQHPDSHPERPWWRLVEHEGEESWVRTDGEVMARVRHKRVGDWYETGWKVWTGRQDLTVEKTADCDVPAVDVMALYDRRNPLQPPPPLCGQVWVDPRDLKEATGAASVAAVGQYLVAVTFMIDGLAMVHRLAGTPIHQQIFRHTPGGPVELEKDWPAVDWPPQDHVLVAGLLSPWAPEASR